MSLFRADRFASLYFVRPLRRLVARRNRLRIPILMYHSVSEISQTGVHPYFATETCPGVFEAQMKFLHDSGYCPISIADVVALLSSGEPDGKKYVAITFDDGYRDFYTHAFPILNNYGLNATVYLPTAYISRKARAFNGKDCLTWTDVRELHKAGIAFGSHSVTHPTLRFLPDRDLEREIRKSKDTIETELGTPVNSFAYPYAFPEQDGEFAHRLRDLLKAAGYQNGVSTVIGSVQSLEERFFLKRLPVNSWDDPTFFQSKLEGDYDWLRRPQYLKKYIKKRMKTERAA
jgi:peptidoglycan/xylan/chitin deacetylase (PgdA/CDA1 family)